jgi:DNA-nicking Smr family endonuclease
MIRIPPRRRRTVTNDEHSLWRAAMRDTEPLPGRELDGVAEPAPSTVAEPVQMPPSPAITMPPGTPPVPAQRQPAPLPFLDPATSAGIDRRTDERLRRGRVGIDGRIDLHGMTQSQAHAALNSFVLRGWHEQRRCLLVITGKGSAKGPMERGGGQGMGVLRQAVPRWLNEAPLRPLVLAIHRAQPKDGGEGALYVLLTRRR